MYLTATIESTKPMTSIPPVTLPAIAATAMKMYPAYKILIMD